MMHFENKQKVIEKVDSLLNNGGKFCLSIDKSQSEYIDMGDRKLRVYPDTVDNITSLISKTAMKIDIMQEIEFAFIISCRSQ